jgi:hypothetical protein
MRPGDVITEVAGKPVRNVAELLTNVAALPPGTAAPSSCSAPTAAPPCRSLRACAPARRNR